MHPFSMIECLRNATPDERPEILETTYRKNLTLFREKYPQILDFIQNTTCPYQLDITDNFVQIVHTPTGRLAHPDVGLDRFAEMMGDWIHDAWVDLLNFRVSVSRQYPQHHQPISEYETRLLEAFPQYKVRFDSGRINLKEIGNGNRFSPPTIFLGIFHGLHIARYLERTELASALFIEPEPERFEVSCYFLDYTEIDSRFGSLHLSIGSSSGTPAIDNFFSLIHITPQVWVRVLPGYSCEQMPFFVEVIKGLQSTNADVVYPLDHELKGLLHGKENLRHGWPVLTRQPSVSKDCRIAVVATGPSLNNDLQWLKDNQDRLIIFAVHSSVKILRDYGIRPDFQFNLDAVIEAEHWQSLALFEDIPFISDYRVPPYIADMFNQPLLCSDICKQGAVSFPLSLANTHPSTTNLATSFACFCQPAELYFLGCDFGYRSVGQDHAIGSIYDAEELKKKLVREKTGTTQSLLEPNFSNTGPVMTVPVHLRTKIVVEQCLMMSAGSIKVVNCSDGARIVGAVPRRSSSVRLSEYAGKAEDCRSILRGFQAARQGKNWHSYKQTGAERLRILKKDLIRELTLTSFDWKKFSQILDAVLTKVLIEKRGESGKDTRMEIYFRLLVDLLKLWYHCLVLFDDREDAEAVYHKGYAFLQDVLEDLHWPEELDR